MVTIQGQIFLAVLDHEDPLCYFKSHIVLLNFLSGYTETVNLLIEARAAINMTDSKGCSALFWAASNVHKRTILTLLHGGADVRLLNIHGQSVLDCASAHQMNKKEDSCIRMLQAAGAKFKDSNKCRSYKLNTLSGLTLRVSELTDLCRVSIRRHLLQPDGGNQCNIFMAVSKLPLPYQLKCFLQWNF